MRQPTKSKKESKSYFPSSQTNKNEPNATSMKKNLKKHHVALTEMDTRKSKIPTGEKISDLIEMAPSGFLKNLKKHSYLNLVWPLVVDKDVLTKISKLTSGSDFSFVMSNIFEIASGKFQNATLLSTGPYVYRCIFYWTISKNLIFIFSINPTYCPVTRKAYQYIRIDEYLQKATLSSESLLFKANRALGVIEECDVSLACVFDPHSWKKYGNPLPPRSLEGMVGISYKGAEATYFPVLSDLCLEKVYLCKDLALSGFMQNRVAKSLNRRLMEKVICAESIDQWIDEWIYLERDKKKEYMKMLSEEERNVIKEESNVVMMGRSGTGKTLCGLMRILAAEELFCESLEKACIQDFEEEKSNYMIDPRFPPFVEKRKIKFHSIFLTASAILALEVKKRFIQGMKVKKSLKFPSTKEPVASNSAEASSKILLSCPKNMEAIQDNNFPLFLTSRKLLELLDSTLDTPFFNEERKSHCNIDQYMIIGAKGNNEIETIDSIEVKELDINNITDRIIEEINNNTLEEKKKSVSVSHSSFSKRKHRVSLNGIEVGYEQFKNFFWNQELEKKLKNGVSSSAAWKEICTNIKGGVASHTFPGGYIPEKEYKRIVGARSFLNETEIKNIYLIFIEYQNWLKRNWHYDQNDLLNHILNCIKWGYRGVPLHEIICDEIQDLPPAYFLVLAIITEQKLLLAGDTAQAISEGIGFRFQDLRSTFHDFYIPVTMPKLMPLSKNYRSHRKIIDLGNSVIRAIELLFPDSIDKLKKETGARDGIIPMIIENEMELKKQLPQSSKKALGSPIEFGFNQAIIVRSTEAKKQLPEYLKKGLCFTVAEAKGLEFDDLIIYNFFADSQLDESDWKLMKKLTVESIFVSKYTSPDYLDIIIEQLEVKDKKVRDHSRLQKSEDSLVFAHVGVRDLPPDIYLKYRGLLSELKQLYTAITRAREKIYIFDNANLAKREPIEEYWRKLNFVSNVSEISQPTKMVFIKEKESTTQEWEIQALKLFRQGLYEEAIKAFEHAGNKEGKKRAKAFLCSTKATELFYISQNNGKNQQLAREYFYIAIKRFNKLNLFLMAARCYYTMEDYLNAAKLLKKEREAILEKMKLEPMNDFDNALNTVQNMEAKCHLNLGNFETAMELYFELKNWKMCAYLLCKLQKFEQFSLFIRKHPEQSSVGITPLKELLLKENSLAYLTKDYNRRHITNIIFFLSLQSEIIKKYVTENRNCAQKFFPDLIPSDTPDQYYIDNYEKKEMLVGIYSEMKTCLDNLKLEEMSIYISLYFNRLSDITQLLLCNLIQAHNVTLGPKIKSETTQITIQNEIKKTKNIIIKISNHSEDYKEIEADINEKALYLGFGISPLNFHPRDFYPYTNQDVLKDLSCRKTKDKRFLLVPFCHYVIEASKKNALSELTKISEFQFNRAVKILLQQIKVNKHRYKFKSDVDYKNFINLCSIYKVKFINVLNSFRFQKNYVVIIGEEIKKEVFDLCEKVVKRISNSIHNYKKDIQNDLLYYSPEKIMRSLAFMKKIATPIPISYYTEEESFFLVPLELVNTIIIEKVILVLGRSLLEIFKSFYIPSPQLYQDDFLSKIDNHFSIMESISSFTKSSDVQKLQEKCSTLFCQIDSLLFLFYKNRNFKGDFGNSFNRKEFLKKEFENIDETFYAVSELEVMHKTLYRILELSSLLIYKKIPYNPILISKFDRRTTNLKSKKNATGGFADPIYCFLFWSTNMEALKKNILFDFHIFNNDIDRQYKIYQIMELFAKNDFCDGVINLSSFLHENKNNISMSYYIMLINKAITSLVYLWVYSNNIPDIFIPKNLLIYIQDLKWLPAWNERFSTKYSRTLLLQTQLSLLTDVLERIGALVKNKYELRKEKYFYMLRETSLHVYELFIFVFLNYPLEKIQEKPDKDFFHEFVKKFNKYFDKSNLSSAISTMKRKHKKEFYTFSPIANFNNPNLSSIKKKLITKEEIVQPFCSPNISIIQNTHTVIEPPISPPSTEKEAKERYSKDLLCLQYFDYGYKKNREYKAMKFLSNNMNELLRITNYYKISNKVYTMKMAKFFSPFHVILNFPINSCDQLNDLIYFATNMTISKDKKNPLLFDELKAVYFKELGANKPQISKINAKFSEFDMD